METKAWNDGSITLQLTRFAFVDLGTPDRLIFRRDNHTVAN